MARHTVVVGDELDVYGVIFVVEEFKLIHDQAPLLNVGPLIDQLEGKESS